MYSSRKERVPRAATSMATRLIRRITVLFFFFSVGDCRQLERSVRGLSIARARSMNEGSGTEIPLQDEENKDEKKEKESDDDDVDADYSTETPTHFVPTTNPTFHPTTSTPSWSPFGPVTDQVSTLGTLDPESSTPAEGFTNTSYVNPEIEIQTNPEFQSSFPAISPASSTISPPPSNPSTTAKEMDASTQSSLDKESDSLASTDVGDNSTNDKETSAPDLKPAPLNATSAPPQKVKASAASVIGVVFALGSIACLTSYYFAAQRRKKQNGTPDEDIVLNLDHSVSMVAPPGPVHITEMNWSDVFHHSLADTEKINVSPTCRKKSLLQSTVAEEDGEVTNNSDTQRSTATLTPSEQEEVVLRKVEQQEDDQMNRSLEEGTYQEPTNPAVVDSFAKVMVASFLDCGGISSNNKNDDEDDDHTVDEEKKTQEEHDMRSITSEDLEYQYGTPLEQLPETPRTSNVSPEGKLDVSQRAAMIPSLEHPTKEYRPPRYLLGPEMDTEDEELEGSDLLWV